MRTPSTARRQGAMRLGMSAIAVSILLAGCGPTTPEEASSGEAVSLATALQSKLLVLEASGVNVPVPAVETLSVLYGADGGIACINAESPLISGFNAGHFGSASGRRPGVLDPAALAYDVAVLTTYCPDVVEEYKSVVEGWISETTLPGS